GRREAAVTPTEGVHVAPPSSDTAAVATRGPDADTLHGLPVASAEERRAAAAQLERAREALTGGNREYAIQLLLSCGKLDPTNVHSRRALGRAVQPGRAPRRPGFWRGWLSLWAARAKIKAARHAGSWLKVLEHGEQLLTTAPDDLDTARDMAVAAEQ